MILSDHSIRQLLHKHPNLIRPTPEEYQMQPASVDLRLGTDFSSTYNMHAEPQSFVLAPRGQMPLNPMHFILGCTMEKVSIPTDYVARVEGKSTWGRQGLMIHATAGFIDPGFQGQITLELFNLSNRVIYLTVGEPIAQICFQMMTTHADRPYGNAALGSKYQGQTGATPAKVRS